MSHRLIAVQLADLTSEREQRIRETASSLGFEIKVLKKGNGYEASELSDCEILFGSFSPKELPLAGSMRWFAAASAGVNTYVADELYCHPDVILTNSSGAYGVAIAEHMLTVILMLMRRMREYEAQQREKKWNYLGKIRSIYGSTIAVVGIGDIGGTFAKRCKALGAKVIGVKRTMTERPEYIDELYTTDRLCEAISKADVVALCLPGTSETQHIISDKQLEAMKTGAILVNVGRGSAVDENALLRALDSGKLYGAALDVTETEPLPESDPLWSYDNVIITPHISGNDSLDHNTDTIIDMFLANLHAYAKGETMHNVIDRKRGY